MRRLSLWMRAHPTVGDSLIVVLLVLLQLPSGNGTFTQWQVSLTGYILAVALLLLPLVVRRKKPVLCAYLVLVGGVLHILLLPIPILVADLAVGIALYTLVAYAPRRRAVEYACCLAVATAVWVPLRLDPEPAPWVAGGVVIVLAFCWVLGEYVGARRAYHGEVEQRLRMLETERDQHARIAVAEERARIARELHDVVAHSVSVMVVHADGAGYALRTRPEEAVSAIGTISDVGRDALAELRRLVEVLRSDTAQSDPARPVPEDHDTDSAAAGPRTPQPGARSVTELVDRVRSAGLPVVLDVRGDLDQLPTGVGLAVYRIAQEALTNTMKHAGRGALAHLHVECTGERIELEISDDGHGDDVAGDDEHGHIGRLVPSGGGNGLIGMRERATVFGGTLEAGPRTGGGWRVHAHIPLGEQ